MRRWRAAQHELTECQARNFVWATLEIQPLYDANHAQTYRPRRFVAQPV